jgi:hypothetical protein
LSSSCFNEKVSIKVKSVLHLLKFLLKKMGNACNLSYSGGRDQKIAVKRQPHRQTDLISKTPITKKGWWSGSNSKIACLASVRP